jgi:predicted NBD/HSP70 family sugar kinase
VGVSNGHRPSRGSSGDGSATHAAHLRGLNIDRVLRIAVDHENAFTRAELIQATGLSAPTVGSVTSNLIEKGVLNDLGTAPSRGGRRPGLMEFNSRHGYVAGIDLGPTRTRIAVGDMRGRQLDMRIVETPVGHSSESMMRQLTGELRGVMADAQAPAARLLALVVGAPGPVDLGTGTVLYAPNLSGWDRVPLRAMMQHEFASAIVIENDVNLALLGEHWRGAARGHATCAFMFVGTGIGSAILIDDTLHHGHHYMAGEIGALAMSPDHLGCESGTPGRLEPLAGMAALRQRWDPERAQPPDRWFDLLMDAHARGDERARCAVQETAAYIGMATAQLGAVVDPSVIVLGGSMFAAPGPLVDSVRAVVRQIARTPFEVVLSELGKEAPLAGCLLVGAREAQRALRQQLKATVRRQRALQ